MSRFLSGFTESNAILNRAPVFTTGGSTTGVISTSATPAGNAVATKSQADLLGTGSGSSPTNGVSVLTVVAGQVPGAGAYSHSCTISCNWTVPSGVNRIFAQVWGGGGGGGGPVCKRTSETGGSAGYTHGSFSVQPGDILCIQAGRGGCRGCCYRYGFAGERSHVCNAARSIAIRAYPGQGGRCNMDNYGRGSGAPGNGLGGSLNLCGQCSFSDAVCACHKFCSGRMYAYAISIGPPTFGGFQAPQAGVVAAFCTGSLCGNNNTSPGGGGAGSAMGYPTSNKGGTGGPGLVMIWY